MTEDTPWLSVLIASYDRPLLLQETVVAAINAAIPEMEIIVSDDNSPRVNEIESVLRGFIESGKIKYLCGGRRLGMAGNWNKLVKAARGEYLMIIGDDDRIPRLALRRLRQLIDKHPGGDLYGFGYRVIDAEGRKCFDYCCPRLMHYQVDTDCDWEELCYFDAVPMWSHHPFTMAVNRRVYERLTYRTDVDCGGDVVFLWSALAQRFKFVVLPEVLFEWRVSAPKRGYSNLSSHTDRLFGSRALVAKTMLEMDALPASMRSLFQTEKFLKRFLVLADSDLPNAKTLLSGGGVSDLMHLVKTAASAQKESSWDKVVRHFRAIRVMGVGHVLQIFRFFLAKRRQSKLL